MTAAADVQSHRASGRSWITYGLNQSGTLTSTPAPTDAAAVFFDNYIEYEYIDDGKHKVGLYVGDSLTEGKGVHPIKSWPSQHSAVTGVVAVNIACAGTQTTYFTSPTAKLWTKLDIASYRPDFAFVTLGTNDAASAARPLADFQANIVTIANNLRALGIERIFFGIIPPRSGPTAGNTEDALRASYRTWVASLPAGAQVAADFDTVLRDPAAPLQMRPDWQTDGLHQNTAGLGRMAHEAGAVVVGVGRTA